MSNGGRKLADINVDITNLYQEETFTDLKIGTMRRYSPVKPDGTPDAMRATMYVAHTQLMSQMGPLPIDAPIEAANLADAWQKFPEAIQQAVEEMVKEMQKRQIEEASRIVVPGQGGPGGMTPNNLKLI